MGGLELEEVSPLSLIWMIGSMNKRLQVCNSSATTDSMNWEIEQVAADLCFFPFPKVAAEKLTYLVQSGAPSRSLAVTTRLRIDLIGVGDEEISGQGGR